MDPEFRALIEQNAKSDFPTEQDALVVEKPVETVKAQTINLQEEYEKLNNIEATEYDPEQVKFDKPAETLQELNMMVEVAKQLGIKYIEATDKIIKSFNAQKMPDCGYFFYKDIRVYVIGKREEVEKHEKRNYGKDLGQ